MPHTNTWSNAVPADSDLASNLGLFIRNLKLDITERMGQAGHVWNSSAAVDGNLLGQSVITAVGTQNDFPIVVGHPWFVCNNATPLNLTGVSGGYDGAELYVLGLNSTVSIQHENASSAATNRFTLQRANAPMIFNKGFGYFRHNGVRWLEMYVNQGFMITPTFNGADFGGGGGGTWTVDAGDRFALQYIVENRMLTVTWALRTTTMATTPSFGIIANGQWGGFQAVGNHFGSHWYVDGAGASDNGPVEVSGTQILLYTKTKATFPNGTNNITSQGSIKFEVN